MFAEPGLPSVGTPSSVRLELHSRPETLTLVRAVLGALGERLAIDVELLDDLKTAVSEACNNVVQHAYPDGSAGPLRLELFLLEDSVVVLVRDRGVGIDESTLGSDIDAGVGIPVIRTLAATVRFSHPAEGGTELTMIFAADRDGQRLIGAPPPAAAPFPHPLSDPVPAPAGEIGGSISPVWLLGPVLGRLARTLAARVEFSLDRFSDVYLVTDEIGALMERASLDNRGWFTLRCARQCLELIAGPLAAGSIARLQGAVLGHPHASPLLALSDQMTAGSSAPGSESLHVVLRDSASTLPIEG